MLVGEIDNNYKNYGGEFVVLAKLVLFDLDGTLIDSDWLYEEGWIVALDKYGFEISRDQLDDMIGATVSYNNGIIQSIVKDTNLTKKIRELRDQHFMDGLLGNRIKLIAGAEDLIDRLAGKSNLALVTSTPRELKGEAILETYSIFEAFDYFVFGDEVTNGKPDPESYELALKKAGVSAEDAVTIEDSLTGAKSSLAAGIRTIVINNNEDLFDGLADEGRLMRVDSLEEVMGLLEG